MHNFRVRKNDFACESINLLFQRYYRPAGVFLLYNFLDLVGRTLATWFPPIPIKLALSLAILRLTLVQFLPFKLHKMQDWFHSSVPDVQPGSGQSECYWSLVAVRLCLSQHPRSLFLVIRFVSLWKYLSECLLYSKSQQLCAGFLTNTAMIAGPKQVPDSKKQVLSENNLEPGGDWWGEDSGGFHPCLLSRLRTFPWCCFQLRLGPAALIFVFTHMRDSCQSDENIFVAFYEWEKNG